MLNKTLQSRAVEHATVPNDDLILSQFIQLGSIVALFLALFLSSFCNAQALHISSVSVVSEQTPEIVYWGLVEGEWAYTDRDYRYLSVPSAIAGANLIVLANNDKFNQSDKFVTFNVNKPVTIYVMHDDRYHDRPGWLNTFSDTGQDVLIGGEENTAHKFTMSVFSKNYPAGTINLGGNYPMNGGNYSQYTVAVLEQNFVVSNAETTSGRTYEIEYPIKGNRLKAYVDRDFQYESIPAWLQGAAYIRTANNDKFETSENFLTFDANKPVTVYVMHDRRHKNRPEWLWKNFNYVRLHLAVNVKGNNAHTFNMDVFAKDFPAGTITLGGNYPDQYVGTGSMYTVAVIEQSYAYHWYRAYGAYDEISHTDEVNILIRGDGRSFYKPVGPDYQAIVGPYQLDVYDDCSHNVCALWAKPGPVASGNPGGGCRRTSDGGYECWGYPVPKYERIKTLIAADYAWLQNHHEFHIPNNEYREEDPAKLSWVSRTPGEDILHCDLEFPQDRWYCNIKDRFLNIEIPKIYEYGNLEIPIGDLLIDWGNGDLNFAFLEPQLSLNLEWPSWPECRHYELLSYAIDVKAEGKWVGEISPGHRSYNFSLANTDKNLWQFTELADSMLLTSAISFDTYRAESADWYMEMYVPETKYLERIPATCGITATNFSFSFDSGDAYLEIDYLKDFASYLIDLLTARTVIHGQLLDASKGALCAVDKIADATLKTARRLTRENIQFADLPQISPPSYLAILSALNQARAIGAITLEVEDMWAYFLDNSSTFRQSCLNTNIGTPSEEAFENYDGPTRDQGIANARAYSESLTELKDVQAQAWMIVALGNVSLSEIDPAWLMLPF